MRKGGWSSEIIELPAEKGLKPEALGLIPAVIIATASVAPAYSLAVTLVFVVRAVGLQAPVVAVLAFVPMLFTSIGYHQLNQADPDCGTTFTWAARAFRPGVGWAAGWAIIAADVLVMVSLARVAGQYGFLLFDARGIGSNPASGWVLLVGVLWIVVMTYISYRGIEVAANLQKVLLGIEVVMLFVLSVTALVHVATGHAPAGYLTPGISWLDLGRIPTVSAFVRGIILMVFIYWGWDTALVVNEETRNTRRTPGLAAILSTVILLLTYALVIFSMQSFAGIKATGNGLGNLKNAGDVLSVQGAHVFGTSGAGLVLTHLLLLMVLSSAAAATQTTILPAARTTLSMAVYKAMPGVLAKVSPRYRTPAVSTVIMGAVSIIVYAAFNYAGNGSGVIGDAVVAIGLYIAFYYGLTGFTCAWSYRRLLLRSARNLWLQGILPVTGGLMLYFLGGWSLWLDYDVAARSDYTMWTVPFIQWHIGGAFVIAAGAALTGLIVCLSCRFASPPFFLGQTLTRAAPTLARHEGPPGPPGA